MADPYSIITATVGFADVWIRFGKFLKRAIEGAQTVDEDLNQLSLDFLYILDTIKQIQALFSEEKTHTRNGKDISSPLADLWTSFGRNNAACERTLGTFLDEIESIEDIKGPKALSKLDGLRKWLKKEAKDEAFTQLRESLQARSSALQMNLLALNLAYARSTNEETIQSFEQQSQKVSDLKSEIRVLNDKLASSSDQHLLDSIASAEAVVSSQAFLNEHFDVPHSVVSTYIGRSTESNILKTAITASHSKCERIQKRFVIYGLGGAGKTQFCLKFAQDYRESFWGIFWIDASTYDNAAQSFAKIAAKAGHAPNMSAGKDWLSRQNQPWLVIIDNADSDRCPIEDFYPVGEGGVIIITTKNPDLRSEGTMQPGSFEFNALEEAESNTLLLKEAAQQEPWDDQTKKTAAHVCAELGFLPLAIRHAGYAIRRGICKLNTYLAHLKEVLEYVRQSTSENRTSKAIESELKIYSSFEITYHALEMKGTEASKDALDILTIFSFLDRQNIRKDIFLRAVANPKLEEDHNKEKDEVEASSRHMKPRQTWKQFWRQRTREIKVVYALIGGQKVLPKVLGDEKSPFQELRFNYALQELRHMSLIFEDTEGKVYSMHRVLHQWIRERPKMKLREQAVWCYTASTILAQSVLFPTIGNLKEDLPFLRDVLSHVIHVQKCEREISARMEELQRSRNRWWHRLVPSLRVGLTPETARQLSKFAFVYGANGRYLETEKLLSEATEYCNNLLGMEHLISLDFNIWLCETRWLLSRANDAVQLNKELLEVCRQYRGEEDPRTLKVMRNLGQTYWTKGDRQNAIPLAEKALTGFEKVQGREHADTYNAMWSLAVMMVGEFRFQEAIDLASEAVNGLSNLSTHGPTHPETLEAKDNLAVAYLERAEFVGPEPGDIEKACALEEEVWECRKRLLGKEHPYSLAASCELARIKSFAGDTDGALAIIGPSAPVSERDMGPAHFAFLIGKMQLGRIFLRGGRVDEAEAVLTEVVEAYESLVAPEDVNQLDRLLAIFALIKCRNMQGRQSETMQLRKQFLEGVRVVYGENHPFAIYHLDPKRLGDVPS